MECDGNYRHGKDPIPLSIHHQHQCLSNEASELYSYNLLTRASLYSHGHTLVEMLIVPDRAASSSSTGSAFILDPISNPWIPATSQRLNEDDDSVLGP